MHDARQTILDGTVEEIQHNTTSYCPLAWMHFHLSTEADVRVCCVSEHGAQHSLGNINQQSFEEIWQGASYRELRHNMLTNQPNAACRSCVATEATLGWSHRHNMIRDYHHLALPMVQGAPATPRYLDIRFNNLCNLRCRSCGLFASSRWYSDTVALHGSAESAYIGIDDSSPLLDSLDDVLPNVEEIYFAGGEPLIMSENFLILDKLIALGNTNLLLRFNTNLVNIQQLLPYVDQFTNIKIMASIDAAGAQLEVMRKDSRWDTILRNLRILRSYPSVQLNVTCTVQIMNVLEAFDLHQQLYDLELIGADAFFYHILHAPVYYNMQNLPEDLKQAAVKTMQSHIEWIRQHHLFAGNISGIEHAIAYIRARESSPQLLSQLGVMTARLDRLRNENTPLIFPRLNSIWQQYYIEERDD